MSATEDGYSYAMSAAEDGFIATAPPVLQALMKKWFPRYSYAPPFVQASMEKVVSSLHCVSGTDDDIVASAPPAVQDGKLT